MRINDGGPAFPRPASEYTKSGTCPDGNDPHDAQDGMSMRDYFAAAALTGVLANQPLREAIQRASADLKQTQPALTAQLCYESAEAMLQARKETP